MSYSCAPFADEQRSISLALVEVVRNALGRFQDMPGSLRFDDSFCLHWTRFQFKIKTHNDFAFLTVESLSRLQSVKGWTGAPGMDKINFLKGLLSIIMAVPSQIAIAPWVQACIYARKTYGFT